MPGLTPKTISQAKKLIDWYSKLDNMKRKNSLEAFIDAHGKKDTPSEKTLKKLMMQLSYASIEPDKVDFRKIPSSHKKRIKAIQQAFEEGLLDKEKTSKACSKYLEHGIHERISELPDLNDKEIRGMQEKFGENLNKLAKEYSKRMDAHPVRIYGIMWRWTGNKVHNEVPQIIKNSTEEELLKNMRRLWHSNYLKAHASWQYQKATNLVIDLQRKIERGELDEMPSEKEKKMIKNLYKSVDRYPFKKRKSAPAFMTREKLVKQFKGLSTKLQLEPDSAKEPFYKKKLFEIGRHLNAGTKIYHESMKKRDEIKIKK